MKKRPQRKAGRFVCLITGYFNFKLNDGGTASAVALLERLHQDGFETELICLTDRVYDAKHLASKSKNPNFRVIAREENRTACRLKGYSFPLTFHAVDIDMKEAFRREEVKTLSRLAERWRSILAETRPDITLTVQDDVFAMSACLSGSFLRLHRISTGQPFDAGSSAYHGLLRRLAPRFRFISAGAFLKNKVKAELGQECFSLPPLVDFSRFKTGSRPSDRSGTITLINASPLKGLFIFLSLARTLPQRTFLVRGRRDIIEPYLEKYGISNVLVDERTEDIQSVYRKTRLLLVPSLWDEVFPRVILEAEAAGVPIIANEIGGIKEALHGSGFTVRVNLKMRDRPDFYVNPRYHFSLIEQYLDEIARLNDPQEYARASADARAAAKRAEKEQEERYRQFLNWLKRNNR